MALDLVLIMFCLCCRQTLVRLGNLVFVFGVFAGLSSSSASFALFDEAKEVLDCDLSPFAVHMVVPLSLRSAGLASRLNKPVTSLAKSFVHSICFSATILGGGGVMLD